MYGQKMLSIFVIFGEDFCKISFNLDVLGMYEFLMYSFSNRIFTYCYMSEAFGCSLIRPIYASYVFII